MNNTRVKQTTLNYLQSFTPFCNFALTLQTNICTYNVDQYKMPELEMLAKRSVKQFIRRFASASNGNGAIRKPNLYHPLIITTIEGTLNNYDSNRTLHAHIALGNVITPYSNIKSEAQLRETVREAWLATYNCADDIDIQDIYSSRWVKYIRKEQDGGNMECVDWENCYIPHAALLN